jgi:uncharacterized membrane protein YphA (DoxX/SURF4 family)
MLNPFPDLFTYTTFAPMLLRIAVALIFAYVAWVQWRRRRELAQTPFPFVGAGAWMVWVFIIVELIAAVGLFLGFSTQWVAILGALIALKTTVWGRRYPRYFVLTRITALLVLVVCLSLLLTGAGQHALDVQML